MPHAIGIEPRKEDKSAARLSGRDLAGLEQVFADILPPDSRVYLFGSRADPAARGGDIDLLVHVPGILQRDALALRKRLALALMAAMDEQKIDIVVTPAVDETASTFVQLVWLDAAPLWP